MGRASELLVVQKAALPEKVSQKAGLKVEPTPLPGAEFKCSKVSRHWCKDVQWNGKIKPLGYKREKKPGGRCGAHQCAGSSISMLLLHSVWANFPMGAHVGP